MHVGPAAQFLLGCIQIDLFPSEPSMPDEPEYLLHYHDVYHASKVLRAISEWARFEHAIDRLVWDLLRLEPEQGACMTAQFPSVMSRFDALLAVAKLEGIAAKHIMALNVIRQDSNGPREARNRLVHDPWFSNPDTKQHYRLQLTAKSKLDYNYKAVTEAEVDAIGEQFNALHKRFSDLAHEIRMDFYKLPGESR
jgi:hypothetical protein